MWKCGHEAAAMHGVLAAPARIRNALARKGRGLQQRLRCVCDERFRHAVHGRCSMSLAKGPGPAAKGLMSAAAARAGACGKGFSVCRGRQGVRDSYEADTHALVEPSAPLVVLVNRGTASASEARRRRRSNADPCTCSGSACQHRRQRATVYRSSARRASQFVGCEFRCMRICGLVWPRGLVRPSVCHHNMQTAHRCCPAPRRRCAPVLPASVLPRERCKHCLARKRQSHA